MLYDNDFNLLKDLKDKKTRIELLVNLISNKTGEEKRKLENNLKHVLDDMIDDLKDECLKNDICPKCGGSLFFSEFNYINGEPPEYLLQCEDCGRIIEEEN